MSDYIIKVEHLTKKYIIGHQRAGGYTTLRDVIARKAGNLGKKVLSPFSNAQSPATEELFALC